MLLTNQTLASENAARSKMLNKKSQGLSINVVILAVIALAVLVVVIMIFTRQIGKTSENLGSCLTKGGECADKNGQCPEGHPVKIFVSGGCKDTNPKNLCCIKTS